MNRKVIPSLIASIVIVMCVVVYFFAFEKNEKSERYDIVVFGDSIIAGEHNEITVPAIMEKTSDYSVLNAGFGGMTLAANEFYYLSGDNQFFYTMLGLSECLRDNDFSNVVSSCHSENELMMYYWEDTARALNEVDWSSVKYIVFEHGANDYLTGIKLDNANDKYDVTTYGGALRRVIENVEKGAPNAQLIIMTPIYMFLDYETRDCNEVTYGGGYLYEYVEKELEVAYEYGIDIIDNFHYLGIDRNNYQDYLPGGLHGNEKANELLANRLLEYIKELEDE